MATITGDQFTPSTANFIQAKLGLEHQVMSFDINAACTGFVYALEIATSMLSSGRFRSALVIGGEKLTNVIDYTDRNTCVLFGDGAGAMIIEPGDQDAFFYNAAKPDTNDTLTVVDKIRMDGKKVYQFAVDIMEKSIYRILDDAKMTMDDIDIIIPHQANERIIQSVAKSSGIPMDKFMLNLSEYGNTSAASIPITIAEYAEKYDMKGKKMLLVGFGGGFTWGSSLGIKMKNICELLKIKYPLIQGGMANVATAELAAAVSNAGALGLIGAGGYDANWVREQIKICKSLTDKPFGVNIMLMSPHAPDIAKVVVEEGVKVVTTGAGSPGIYMESWKKAGMVVIPVVPSVALAIRMERQGADAVIAEGTESGGHIGELTTMAIIPQIADAVSIPVIAAGGIADQRGVLAAFALGAKGVQVGTVLLATKECPIHENYKQKVISAKDTDTIVTGRGTGAPVRVLKNKMAIEYNRMASEGIPLIELEKLTLGSLRRAVFDGNLETGSFMAGQIAGLVKEIKTVQEVMSSLFDHVDDYRLQLEVI